MEIGNLISTLILKKFLDFFLANIDPVKTMTREQVYSFMLYSLFNIKYRIQITGARDYTDKIVVKQALKEFIPEYCVVVHGNCSGADKLCGEIATKLGFEVEVFPAQWNKYGRAAGPLRNIQMLDTKPNVVLVFHRCVEKSKGTKHCATEAIKRNLLVKYYK
jgi:hypothetical protein